jgi:hypothetical protein
LGVVRAGGLLGVVDGRLECSWALSEKLIAAVIMAKAKNLFIIDPLEVAKLGRQIITVDRAG